MTPDEKKVFWQQYCRVFPEHAHWGMTRQRLAGVAYLEARPGINPDQIGYGLAVLPKSLAENPPPESLQAALRDAGWCLDRIPIPGEPPLIVLLPLSMRDASA